MRARCALLFLVLLALSARAYACSCAGSGLTCGAMKPGGTLFLGEVVAHKPVNIPAQVPGRNDLFTRENLYRIRIIEAFAGTPTVGEEVEVRTGNGGGDCGYGFVVGKRYLVDAYDGEPRSDVAEMRNVRLATGICTRTREEESATVQLRELRTETAHGREPDLHGSVRSLAERYAMPGIPLQGVTVRLTAAADGAVYQAQTDGDGVYTFPVLPPGDYRPEFLLPARQQLIHFGGERPLKVAIPSNLGTGLACHLDVQAGSTGGVRGTVVDDRGRGLEGNIFARAAGKPSGEMPDDQNWSGKDGTFELQYLQDGEYVLDFQNYQAHLHGSTTVRVSNGEVTQGVVLTAQR